MIRFTSAATLACALACGSLPAVAQVHAQPDPVGDALQYIVPLGAAGMTWYHHDLEGTKQLGVSFLVSQGTTEVLKHAIDQPRPDGTGYGMPSGHTSAVFSAAAFVHRRYGFGEAWPFYILATVTAYERVHTNHHTTEQVIGGAAVGVASSFIFTHPLPDGGQVGVGMHGNGPWLTYARAW
jgi:membrane-associated phospholipid phosphatase